MTNPDRLVTPDSRAELRQAVSKAEKDLNMAWSAWHKASEELRIRIRAREKAVDKSTHAAYLSVPCTYCHAAIGAECTGATWPTRHTVRDVAWKTP